jgi:hypothetical protein
MLTDIALLFALWILANGYVERRSKRLFFLAK